MAAPINQETGGKESTAGQRPGHQSAVELLTKRWSAEPQDEETPLVKDEETPPAEEEETLLAEEEETPAVEEEEETPKEVADEPPKEVAEKAEQDPDEPTEESWKNLAEVIEAAGVDPKELPVTVRSNGEEIQTTLHEALEGYQREADYTRRRQELDTERDDVLSQQKGQLEKLISSTAELGVAAAVISEIMEADQTAVHTAYGAVDWDALRAEDKAEYSARRADYNQALTNTEQRRDAVMGRINGAIEEATKEAKKAKVLYKNEQYKQLLERVPEWKDDKVLVKESGKVTLYLKTVYKATDKELLAMMDHRALDMARKAMLFDELKENGKKVSRKLQKSATKKLVKPGASKAAPSRLRRSSTENAEKAHAALKKSGDQRDAVAALRQRWS